MNDVDGSFIRAYNPIDHDGQGPVEQRLESERFLARLSWRARRRSQSRAAHATAGARHRKFTQFLANSAFELSAASGDSVTAGTTTRYFLIINPRSGTGGDGKIGMYSHTSVAGNTLTTVGRLGSAASGTRVTTLGDVVWDTGVWAGKHTDAHPVGASIVPCNEKGVPIGDTCILGAGAALRGYGKYRNHRSQEDVNGGFVQRKYISSVFGQALRKDRLGRVPGYIRIRHAVKYAGLGIPTVTS